MFSFKTRSSHENLPSFFFRHNTAQKSSLVLTSSQHIQIPSLDFSFSQYRSNTLTSSSFLTPRRHLYPFLVFFTHIIVHIPPQHHLTIYTSTPPYITQPSFLFSFPLQHHSNILKGSSSPQNITHVCLLVLLPHTSHKHLYAIFHPTQHHSKHPCSFSLLTQHHTNSLVVFPHTSHILLYLFSLPTQHLSCIITRSAFIQTFSLALLFSHYLYMCNWLSLRCAEKKHTGVLI